jgi:probable F420-dependent oxidoreductase
VSPRFRFGLQAARTLDPADWLDLARRTEADGYASLMVPDHLPRLATFPALMAAAAVTSRITLTTYVLNQDFRPPGILAQEAASVHLLTGGRLELGLGAGWAEPEYHQAGLQFDTARVRVERFDEYLQVVRGLLHADTPFSFAGRWFTLREFQPLPRKAEYGVPPILVGGGSPRILASAARYADVISLSTRATPDSRIDTPNLTLAAVEAKVAAIRVAAGDRFADIALNMTVRDVRVADDRYAAASQLLAEWRAGHMMANTEGLSVQDVLDSPHLAIGTVAQIVEQLEAQRARWGIAYFEVDSRDADAIAPVVARLAG